MNEDSISKYFELKISISRMFKIGINIFPSLPNAQSVFRISRLNT